MTASWEDLLANFAVVALFASLWLHLSDYLETLRRPWRQLALGSLVSFAALATMFMAVEVNPGIFFDLRAAVIAVGAFFGGPIVAAMAALAAGAYRIGVGGAGTSIGLIHIAGAAFIGLGVRALARTALPGALWVTVLGLSVAALVLAVTLMLPNRIDIPRDERLDVPVAILSFLATLLIGLAVSRAQQTSRERHLLATALSQAPEFLYVKDREGRYLAANSALARSAGFKDAADIIGKTEFDFGNPGIAGYIREQEERILQTGEPLIDLEESLEDSSGERRWYRTSKVPVRDRDHNIVGLSGITMDTTALKKLERELTESRDQLSLALGEMSDGLAVFDDNGHLLFCNKQYQQAFPLSAHVRVPGAHIKDILRATAETGEQLDVQRDDIEGWVERVSSLLRVPNDVTIELFDGRHLQIRNRIASDTTSLTIVSDVTEIKKAEQALIASNIDLSRLAATDPLTGLTNRRIFDDALARDMARTARSGSPLCLVLLDVDHFKRYNDNHGHLEGDRCLRVVAQSISASLHREADLAARYGGEEFAIILPETDLEGAVAVAERIRAAISQTSEAQLGRRATVSMGVAEYDPAQALSDPEELVRRADDALYSAKAAGRDRVVAAAQTPFVSPKSRIES